MSFLKSRVPDTFQLGAILAISAFLACNVFCKLRVFNSLLIPTPPPTEFRIAKFCPERAGFSLRRGIIGPLESSGLLSRHISGESKGKTFPLERSDLPRFSANVCRLVPSEFVPVHGIVPLAFSSRTELE